MDVRPLHDRIIVRRDEEGEEQRGGIIIPDTAKEKPQRGTVIAAGNGTLKEGGMRVPLDVKVEVVLAKGQTVASGRRVQLPGPVAGSGGVKKLVWIISGDGPVRIKVGGPMTGEMEVGG